MVTPRGLDPIDIFGWDLPKPGKRNPQPGGPFWLDQTRINKRYEEIRAILAQADEQDFKLLPYKQKDLDQAYELLSQRNGYIDVMEDMTDGRPEVHGRKWNPFAKTWTERAMPPPDLLHYIAIKKKSVITGYNFYTFDFNFYVPREAKKMLGLTSSPFVDVTFDVSSTSHQFPWAVLRENSDDGCYLGISASKVAKGQNTMEVHLSFLWCLSSL